MPHATTHFFDKPGETTPTTRLQTIRASFSKRLGHHWWATDLYPPACHCVQEQSDGLVRKGRVLLLEKRGNKYQAAIWGEVVMPSHLVWIVVASSGFPDVEERCSWYRLLQHLPCKLQIFRLHKLIVAVHFPADSHSSHCLNSPEERNQFAANKGRFILLSDMVTKAAQLILHCRWALSNKQILLCGPQIMHHDSTSVVFICRLCAYIKYL